MVILMIEPLRLRLHVDLLSSDGTTYILIDCVILDALMKRIGWSVLWYLITIYIQIVLIKILFFFNLAHPCMFTVVVFIYDYDLCYMGAEWCCEWCWFGCTIVRSLEISMGRMTLDVTFLF